MSAYIEFFIRPEPNKFIPIGVYCRSSKLYTMFNSYAPWEKVQKLTLGTLMAIRNDIHDEYANTQVMIDKTDQEAEFIKTCTDPMSAKLEAFAENREWRAEFEDTLKDCDRVLGFISFLEDIYDANSDNNEFGIYAGIEVGLHITDKDIV